MRVKIISDSTCDLSPALLERYDIAVTPLCVIMDGKGFHDGVDITPADIFAHVDGGGDLCSTSAVSQYEYGEMFARYANEYDAVVQITIGANFSCGYQNACAAVQHSLHTHPVLSIQITVLLYITRLDLKSGAAAKGGSEPSLLQQPRSL